MAAKRTWTARDDKRLRSGIEAFMSASEISRKIFGGNRTRNAVCSRANKLKLQIRSERSQACKTHKGFERQSFKIARAFDPCAAAAILALDEDQCRWPIEVSSKFEFCQGNKVPGRSYCRHHLEKSLASPIQQKTTFILATN